jgi:hypothetical protein
MQEELWACSERDGHRSGLGIVKQRQCSSGLYVDKLGRRNHVIPDRRHSSVYGGVHPDDFAAIWLKLRRAHLTQG